MADMKKLLSEIGERAGSIEAEEVIIRTKEGDIVIKNPEVAVSKILGRDVYQITGDVSGEKKEGQPKKAQKSDLDEELERILKGLKETVEVAEGKQ
ncbi:MAG: hypothetical protein HYW25_00155 [Candidatus Aenigmarchaeota archaeon]|nr:hypothetical protein [Candidatus Aenigmarchaeota archaeon]